MLINHPEQFDGRKDVVEVADCSALDLEGCFTIEAYVRVPVRQSSRFFTSCIVAKGKGAQNADHNYYLGIVNRDRRVHFHIGDGSGKFQELVSKTQLSVGQWTHVAVVRGHDEMKIFVDGKLDAITKRRLNQVSNDAPLRIGATESTRHTHHIKAQLEKVRIWNRALPGKDFGRRSRHRSLRASSGLILESAIRSPKTQNAGNQQDSAIRSIRSTVGA
jgi:hypothetical protein